MVGEPPVLYVLIIKVPWDYYSCWLQLPNIELGAPPRLRGLRLLFIMAIRPNSACAEYLVQEG